MDTKADEPIRSPGEASRAGLAESDVTHHKTTHGQHGATPERGVEQAGLNAESVEERHNSGETPHLEK